MSTLTVQESGSAGAPTIVFLHGLGVSSWMWHDQVNDLQVDYHCLCVDLPGNGESYKQEWISFEDTANQVASIIRASATGGTAHVVGLSLGAYVALHLYANHAELLQSVLLSGITTRPLPRGWLLSKLVACSSGMFRTEWVLKLAAKAIQLPDDVIPLYVRDCQRLTPLTIKRVYQEVIYFQYPPNLGLTTTTANASDAVTTTTTTTTIVKDDNRVTAPPPMLIVAGALEASIVVQCLADLPTKLLVNSDSRNSSGNKIIVRAAKVPNVHHGWNGEAPELFTKMIRLWITVKGIPDELESVDIPCELTNTSSASS